MVILESRPFDLHGHQELSSTSNISNFEHACKREREREIRAKNIDADTLTFHASYN